MPYLTGICSNSAADLIQHERLVDSIGPLLAARRFGGGAGVEQNAIYLAQRLNQTAHQALNAGDKTTAGWLASLALAAHEFAHGLFILTHCLMDASPIDAFHAAARMEAACERDAHDVRAAALDLMARALAAVEPSSATSLAAELFSRLPRSPDDHPNFGAFATLRATLRERYGAEASRPAQAEAPLASHVRRSWHFSALERLVGHEDPHEGLSHLAVAATLTEDLSGLARFADGLRERLLARYRAAGDDITEQMAVLALICAHAPDILPAEQLMRSLIDIKEFDDAGAVAEQLAALSNPTMVQWHQAMQTIDDAAWRRRGDDPETAQLAVYAAGIERLSAALARKPELDVLRVMRSDFSVGCGRYRDAASDLREIVRRVENGAALPQSIRNGVAANILHLLPTIKHPETAWAARELAADPPNDPSALKLLIKQLSDVGAVAEARTLAHHLAASEPQYALFSLLGDFVEHLDRVPAALFGRPSAGNRRIYASMVCWGSAYIDLLGSLALPSLAAPLNLPELAKCADIQLELVISPQDLEHALSLPALHLLAECCEIRIQLLPLDEVGLQWSKKLPYVVFGHAFHFTLLRARRDGADLLNFHPDLVYANGSISGLAPLIEGPPCARLIDGLNAALTPARARLEPYREGEVLSIDAPALAALAAPLWRPRTTDCLYDPAATTSSHYPHRIIFRTPDRVIGHAFSQGLLYIANRILRRIDLFDFGTNDGFFVDALLDCLRPEELVRSTTYDPIMVLEFDDADGVRYARAPKPLKTSICDMFLIFPYSGRRYWLFEVGVDLLAGELGPVVSSEAHRAFLDGLRVELEALPHVVQLDAERDRVRPDYSRGPLFRLPSD